MDPGKLMESGFIPKTHFQNILGVNVPTMIAVTDSGPIIEEVHSDAEDEQKHEAMTMTKQQQAFSAQNGMGFAAVLGQRMVKQMVQNNGTGPSTMTTSPQIDEPLSSELGPIAPPTKKRRGSTRPSAITNIVLDLPQHAERNPLNHADWTQDLYESLLSSLRFGQVARRIQSERSNSNEDALSGILEKYQTFERIHHTKMNTLKRDKKTILEQIEECDAHERESMTVLRNLVDEHSKLEQKIRPQMKMLLHKMHLVEQRILSLEASADGDNRAMTTEQRAMKHELEQELNYYDTYTTELKNVFIHQNNIRAKYQNTIRTVIEHRTTLDIKLDEKSLEIRLCKQQLAEKLSEFHRAIDSVTYAESPDVSSRAADPLAFDPIKDLTSVLDEKNKNIDSSLDLLSFRIATIPATDYALRVIELCQLSYVYSNEVLKSFFEWFIRFAVQSFIEINYAHTCFNTHNRKAIDEEIHTLKSIQFIAELTAVDQDNRVHFQKALHDQLTVVISYLELLPANDDEEESASSPYGAIAARNNIDHEYVIFHVARYLTADASFSESLTTKYDEYTISRVAEEKVREWIQVILSSTRSDFKFSSDYNAIENEPIKNVICYNKLTKPRNIIRAMKQDSTAQVRPARAAAIVMDHVYGVLVEG